MTAETPAAPEQLKTGYKKGFWYLMVTQFQGAFNDNMFKFLIIYTLWDILKEKAGGVLDQATSEQVVFVAGLLFSIPFIIFAGYSGAFSDRNSKKDVAVWVKYLEVGIMALGTVAFYIQNEYLFWILLFLMATHSTIFSPSKYGLLPEILPESRLSWGNGIIQMMTMIAIISGIGLAGPVYRALHGEVYLAGLLLMGLSCIGLATAHGITRPLPANPQQRIPINPWAGMGRDFRIMWNDRWLLMTIIGYMYFWFVGQFLQQNIMVFGKTTLALDESHISAMTALLALGIGFGSAAAGMLSRGKIEVGLIPLGAVGLSLFAALLALPGTTFQHALIFLFCLGGSAGFFDIPLAATLQQRSPEKTRGSMLATSNMLTFVGMALASVLYGVLIKIPSLTTQHKFLIAAVLSAAVGIYICALLPMFALRFFLWILSTTLYRIDVRGRQNLPDKGGALLVANHTSFLDALVIAASTDRMVRFVMFEGIYKIWWVRPIAKIMKSIPIASSSGARELIESMRVASQAIEAGDVVCIFAEGQITRTGQMLPFKKGFERIMRGVDAPIIPVHLDRLWGSIFSHAEGKFFWKFPSRIPYPITVSYGKPMPPDSSAYNVRHEVQLLATEAYNVRKLDQPLLHRAFVRMARRHPFHVVMADGLIPKMTYLKALIGSIVFADKLKKLLGPEPMTGVLIPPSVGGALTNIALPLMGKVPVNLNYTSGPESIASSAEQCGIRHVITSRAFLEKLPLQVPGEAIYLEDVKQSVTSSDRIKAILKALFLPVRLLERSAGSRGKRSQDDLATIIFSSGSEGKPKGVMLTHYNVSSNLEAALQIFPTVKTDVLVGILPFFHSFGFTGTLWLPLTRNPSISRYDPDFNTHAPAELHSPMRARGIRQPQIRRDRRREAARPHPRGLSRKIRSRAAGGLRHDRMRAYRLAQHPGLPRAGLLSGWNQARHYWSSHPWCERSGGRPGDWRTVA
ncbi:MAG: MFS transporter [Candidatus Hydrogenedentes bacterium]|nr:MFS transporter [Candidatus Hydrogenedentota bacterium]